MSTNQLDLNNLKQSLSKIDEILNSKCDCVASVIRYRTFSNNVRHNGTQCVRCGKFKPVGKDEFATMLQYHKMTMDDVPEFEDSIAKGWSIYLADLWKKKSNIHQRIYAIESELNRKYKLRPYYESDEWKNKRKLRLNLNEYLFNGMCEMCFAHKASHVHHMTYDRMGNEWIFDLAAICPNCHSALHPHMQQEDSDG